MEQTTRCAGVAVLTRFDFRTAGGVGGFAIQLAHDLGGKIITTASAANRDYVSRLGASQVIDYATADFTSIGRVCDVVFDTVGGEVQVRSYEVLKPGGRLVWIAAAPAGFVPTRRDVALVRPAVLRDRAHLERIVSLLESGAVTLPPIQHFPLADAAEAHRISEGRHLRGKLVLEIR
jgi:NADPH:quinone reductase-like Zn-dependent oxidoreductase